MTRDYHREQWERVDTADYAEIHPKGKRLASAIALVGKADDADLIAAAPELLNVATVFASSLEYLIAIDRKNGDDEGASMKGITLNVVRSAIAKAEGRP